MAYRRRRRMTRSRSRSRSGYRPRTYRSAGRGRVRGRARRSGQTIRLVIQTPSDMLPPRPVAGQFARVRRRARF